MVYGMIRILMMFWLSTLMLIGLVVLMNVRVLLVDVFTWEIILFLR